MTLLPTSLPSEEWIRVLAKGMITIPKSFREDLGIKEGEVARIRKIGPRLIIEPRELTDYEVYDDEEFIQMIEEDKLPTRLAKKAAALWPDLK